MVLKPAAQRKHVGHLKKYHSLVPSHRNSDVIGLRYGQGTGIFKSPPVVSVAQPRFRNIPWSRGKLWVLLSYFPSDFYKDAVFGSAMGLERLELIGLR